MAGWLEKWFEYLQGLWGAGALVVFVAAGAVITGALVLGVPLLLIALVFGGTEEAAQDWLVASSILWFPVLFGSMLKKMGSLPDTARPPSWSDWKAEKQGRLG